MDYPDIDCDPPDQAEVGQIWYCPGCARKFNYSLFELEDTGEVYYAWFTMEI